MSEERASSSEPRRKRLKQSTLEFSFVKKSKVKASSQEDLTEGDEVTEILDMNPADSERRQLLAAAAEKRWNSSSPWSNSQEGKTTSQNIEGKHLSASSSTDSSGKTPLGQEKAGTSSPQRTKHPELSNKTDSVFDYLEKEKIDDKPSMEVASSISNALKDLECHDFLQEFEENSDSKPSSSKANVGLNEAEKSSGKGSGAIGNQMSEEQFAKGVVFDEDESPTLEVDYSQPLFSDSDSQNEDLSPNANLEDVPPLPQSTSVMTKGHRISELLRAPDCRASLPVLKPDKSLTILFRPHIRTGSPPRPFPDSYQDRWDSTHVRMPCSPDNLYPVEDKNGKKEVKSRWDLVEMSLFSRDIESSLDLEEAILAYNTRYNKKWNFQALHSYFTEVLDHQEATHFFESILPGVINLALQLPKICTQPIPLLKKQCNHTIILTQHQAASLLANAFFCTFPRRNTQQKKSEYSSFPDINFNRLFEGRNPKKTEKLKCLVNYFRRVTTKPPTGTISFTRRVLKDSPEWEKSTARLSKLYLSTHGMIEEEGGGMLQMDFANKFLGGGVLGMGLVQEEIRFMICPELILSRLFTESLECNDCLVIKGVERFSSYSGYTNTFKWTGNYVDNTTRDMWGRRETEILALDALRFNRSDNQFKPDLMRRELNKAYCGFHEPGIPKAHLPAIATGNWGCGVFGGDPRLKALLQIMAASEAERDLAYFTFHDLTLCEDVYNMYQFLTSQVVTVGELWVVLRKYRQKMLESKNAIPKLYPFIYDLYTNYDSDTEDTEVNDQGQEEQNTVALKSAEYSQSPDYKVDTP